MVNWYHQSVKTFIAFSKAEVISFQKTKKKDVAILFIINKSGVFVMPRMKKYTEDLERQTSLSFTYRYNSINVYISDWFNCYENIFHT
jgi:hypothetical protein